MRGLAVGFAALLAATLAACSGGSTYGVPWKLVHADRNSAVAVVAYFHGDCDSLHEVRTISTPSTVTFKITVSDSGGTCDAAGKTTAIRIRLGGKLRDREITGSCHPHPGILCFPLKSQTFRTGSSLPIYGP